MTAESLSRLPSGASGLLLSALFLLACGGGDTGPNPRDAGMGEAAPDTSAGGGVVADGAEGDPGVGGRTPVDTADSAPGVPEPGGPGRSEGADAPSSGSVLPPWRTTEIRGTGIEWEHVVRDVRVARHEDYDRFVVEFEGTGPPPWRVTPSTGPSTDCGSGRELELAGRSLLDVEFTSSRAHTEEGRSTLDPREPPAGLPAIREIHMTCDFEAHVSWALGVEGDPVFRVFHLESPSRLVVDVRH